MELVSRSSATPAFSCQHLPAGTRLGVAVSGGGDSVALLRLAHRLAPARGWILQVLHVQHGLRGEDAREDVRFVQDLATTQSLPFQLEETDAAATAREARLGLEEAGRLLRYRWFGSLLRSGSLDAIATGHTLDDQAETVLAKLLRGAWTSGLSGIYPSVAASDLPGAPESPAPAAGSRGLIVRPLLATRRDALRSWLTTIGQPWREDASNQDLQFTRNRIRHELLPALRGFNSQVEEQLAQTAALALAEEQYWQAEIARILPGLLLPGRAVRGGGRASSTLSGERSLAIEIERLRAFASALQRRLVRAIAMQLGVSLQFAETAGVLALCNGPSGGTPRREQLTARLRAERTPRELRFILTEDPVQPNQQTLTIPIPGSGAGFGVRIEISLAEGAEPAVPPATLRPAGPGDRVRLRHSSGAPKRVKEVLERMGIAAPDRAGWPVLEWQGETVWLRGAMLEPTPLSRRLIVTATDETSPDGD